MEECCCGKRETKRSEAEKKELYTRLNRIGGQIAGIKRMVEEDRYCDDILIQLSAADSAIRSLAGVILDRHAHTCLIENIEKGNYQVVDEIVDLFRRFR